MRQVIIVAPWFPPSNLAAGHRSRYFAMYLPKFGWRVKVLTVKPSYYEERLDYELEKLLPPELEMIRTKALPIRPIRLIGDISIRAFWWHYQELCRLVKKERPQLIYVPIPPNYSAMLCYLIYHKFGIPYVIDYMDPWVYSFPGYNVLFSKRWLSYRLGRILEPIILRHVNLITAVSPNTYKILLQRYSWLDESKCIAIPMGAEEKEYQYLDRNPRPTYLFNPDDGNLHIVYAGGVPPKFHPTLYALFEAITIFKKRYPELFQKIKFHFIGTGSRYTDPKSFNVKPLAKRYNLLDIVFEYPGRIAYLDVLNHLRHANVVLILGSPEPHYTPSKVFQAVLSRRPVIAILHQKSTAVSILKEVNAGRVVTFDETKPVGRCIDEIAEAIYQEVNNINLADKINWEIFRAYSAEAMTRKLAEAFDSVLNTN